jgi:hypothetical protein
MLNLWCCTWLTDETAEKKEVERRNAHINVSARHHQPDSDPKEAASFYSMLS